MDYRDLTQCLFCILRISIHNLRKAGGRATQPWRIAAFLSLESEHGRSILRGIARFFRGRPEVTVLKFGQNDHYEVDRLQRLRVQGLIAKAGSLRDEKILASVGLPVVNISGQISARRLTTINTNDLRVGEIALQHLHRRGYRNFAYCGSATHFGSRQRLAAFREAAKHLLGPHAKVATHFLPLGDQTAPYPERQRAMVTRWLRTLPRPVGVFTFTDRVAVEVEEACRRIDLRVPEDIAILGVGNDLTRLEFAHVELSSIQLNAEQIGWLAAQKLEEKLRGGIGFPVENILVPPLKIVTRRSTDSYAVGDAVVGLALDYLRQHLGNPIYVEHVARAVGVSRRGLEVRFRSALGIGVNDEIRRQQLEFAAGLLSEDEARIGEVAFRAGFSSNAAFCRSFREWSGKSPSEYRAALLT